MRGIPQVSRLALYYAGNAPLPSHYHRCPRLSTRRCLFGSFKREEGAPCTWPCALADSGRLSSTSASSSTTKTTTGSSPSSLQLPFTPTSSSFSRVLDSFPLSFLREESFCSSGYAARFISYPTNWEARTAARIPERRFPPLRGMRY